MSVQSIIRSPEQNNTLKLSHFQWKKAAIIVSCALLLLAIACQPVMFSFFTSDDFFYISHFHAVKDYPLPLCQGHSEDTPYYRPLLNLLLFSEYALCGTNGCLFRIVSLVYKIITAVVFGFLLAELFPNEDKQNKIIWPIFSALLFLLYPLHTEPMNWFAGTTEILVNLFILSSFLFYLRWRKQNKLYLSIVSLFFCFCAFLTKEVAVILPAILFAYELFLGRLFLKANINANNRAPALFINSIHTAPYWLLLGGYLLVRKIMLGNFFGSWSNNPFQFADNTVMYKAWLQSLKMIVLPLSSDFFSHNNPVYLIWLLMIGGLTVLTISSVWINNKYRLLMAFIGSWFFISLLPMLKLLLITNELLGNRYGYIASAPLCAFLMFGLARKNNKLPVYNTNLVLLIVLITSSLILRTNNMAWAEVGRLNNNILCELPEIYRGKTSKAKIYFFNIPQQHKGVPIGGLNTIQSMSHIPFLQKNFDNANWLSNDDQSLPLGILHSYLGADTFGSYFYYWDMQNESFHSVNIEKSVKEMPPDSNIKLSMISGRGNPQMLGSKNPCFIFNAKNISCWDTDALALKVDTADIPITKTCTLELSYTNDVRNNNDKEPSDQRSVYLDKAQTGQFILLLLRGIPIWSLGGHCQSIKITSTKSPSFKILEASAIRIDNLMPKIHLSGGNYDKRAGLLVLDKNNSPSIVKYNASSIPECAGITLEALGQTAYFKELNSPHSEENSSVNLISMHPVGQITLSQNLFPGNGLYKVRLRPVDKKGNQVGLCSDHFIVSISK